MITIVLAENAQSLLASEMPAITQRITVIVDAGHSRVERQCQMGPAATSGGNTWAEENVRNQTAPGTPPDDHHHRHPSASGSARGEAAMTRPL